MINKISTASAVNNTYNTQKQPSFNSCTELIRKPGRLGFTLQKLSEERENILLAIFNSAVKKGECEFDRNYCLKLYLNPSLLRIDKNPKGFESIFKLDNGNIITSNLSEKRIPGKDNIYIDIKSSNGKYCYHFEKDKNDSVSTKKMFNNLVSNLKDLFKE